MPAADDNDVPSLFRRFWHGADFLRGAGRSQDRPPEEELNGSNFDPEAEQTMPDEPSEGADQAIQEQLGMAVQPLTADIARDIGVDQGTKGLVIAAVGSNSNAGSKGLRRGRSEEHTSELQSLMRISYAVFCLKKKKNQ